MSLKTHKLRDAIVFALVTGATSVAGTSVALAQDSGQEATTLDRIEVTGSRIRQVDIETAQPVLMISRDDIENQGFNTVADILQNITAAGTPPISRSSPLSSGEAVGGQYIDLRNLGASRTLILLNGQRLGITTSGLQDLAQIPAAVVERIELLKDGASAIYGSDAMAGVVNIITRSNYEGAEVNAYYGQYDEGDGTRERYDFVMGMANDRGSITISGEYTQEDAVWASDRPFSAYPYGSYHPELGWTAVSQWGVATDVGDSLLVLDRGADPLNRTNYHVLDANGLNTDRSNSTEQMQVYTPLERKSMFLDGVLNITDNVRARAAMLYSDRVADSQIAGYPYQSAVFGTPLSIDSYYNPWGNQHGYADPQEVNFYHRGWEVPRRSSNQLKSLRFTGALEGTFTFADRYFDWSVGMVHHENDGLQIGTGNFLIPAVAAAVGPSFLDPATGVVTCGTPDAPIAGCVPWNPLIPAGRSDSGGLEGNAELQDFLFPEEHATSETETTIYNANLAGSLFTLPAGDLGFAVGVEFREEKGGFFPDALSQSGDSTNLASGPTSGGYKVDEYYAEIDVPILSDVPGARELSINAASRYSDYNTFGDTTNNRFGLKWKPVESVLVRATWAEGFRAPTVADLYGGTSDTFEDYTDPCDTNFGSAATNAEVAARCIADGVPADYRQLGQGLEPVDAPNSQTAVAFRSGSNPNLQPETSESKTVGIVWSPGFAEGLNMSLDWWNIRIENTVVDDTPTTMLNDCYILGVESRCANFTRDPVTGMVNSLSFGTRNAGFRETEGFDFDLTYRWQMADWGQFDLSWLNTYVSKNELLTTNDETTPVSPLVSFGGNFRLRSNANLNWEMGDFGATWGVRYYSGMKEACTFNLTGGPECNIPDYQAPDTGGLSPHNRVGGTTFHDIQFRVSLPWNATVSLGANNAFDRQTPVMYTQPNSNFNNYGGFDIGRFWYMKYQQRF